MCWAPYRNMSHTGSAALKPPRRNILERGSSQGILAGNYFRFLFYLFTQQKTKVSNGYVCWAPYRNMSYTGGATDCIKMSWTWKQLCDHVGFFGVSIAIATYKFSVSFLNGVPRGHVPVWDPTTI
jgi:hypothetical protein